MRSKGRVRSRNRASTNNRLTKRLEGWLGKGEEDGIADKLKISKLWTIASGGPKSQRFSQLSFDGFTPRGRNRVERFAYTSIEFFRFLAKYIRRKVKAVVLSLNRSTIKIISGAVNLKGYLTRKLIWSRGRLGRPIATGIIMTVAFFVFMFGEVLNSSRFVVSQEIDPDYLSNVTDIIPQKTVALTTIPESRKQAEAFTYTVEPGDNLSSIGSKFRISVDAIEYVNGLTGSSVLKVGQQLVIPPVSGLIHTVEDGDTIDSIADKYNVPRQAISDFNYILDTSSLAVGTELVIPGAEVPQVITAPIPGFTPLSSLPTADLNATKGWCIWPTTARIITQYFSWYHNGLDIASPGYTYPPLYSCAAGTVIRSGWDPWGLGLHVVVDHGNGYQTTYGHMSRIDVGYGDYVNQGQVIGLLGNTGRSTGPHVHFVVKYNGVSQNPLNYIQ